MKQTAVKWLWEQYNNECDCGGDVEYTLAKKLFEQAKEMEKEQIFDAWENGFREFYDGSSTPEQYYEETYDKD